MLRNRIWIVALVGLLLLATGVLWLVTAHKTQRPVLVSRTDPPKIRFEAPMHDLGNVAEGVEVPHVFKIHNVGGEPLKISNVSTSCGCTMLNLKDKVIEPGKSGELEVVVDTAMKQGFVEKTIDVLSNDPDRPKTTLAIRMNVLQSEKSISQQKPPNDKSAASSQTEVLSLGDPHASLTDAGRAKIFTGNCATCHVDQGRGKLGAELFQADCAMCHGANAQGAVGPALVPRNYQDKSTVGRVLKIIRFGSPTHRSMPGFLRDAGGPLTEAEIQSIVTYLRTQSEAIQTPPAS